MAAKLYRYEVYHPDYGTMVVEDISPQGATNKAAKVWDAPWREIAGYCRVTKLGTAKRPRCRSCGAEFGEPGDVTAYCPTCLRAQELAARERRMRPRSDRRAGMRE